MTITGIGGWGPDSLQWQVALYDNTDDRVVGVTVFEQGSDDPYTFAANWSYNGTDTVSVTFFAENGVYYELDCYSAFSTTATDFGTGTGADMTLTATKTGSPFSNGFLGELVTPGFTGTYNDWSTRLFQQGVAGDGELGNPTGSDPVIAFAPTGVATTSATFEGSANPEGVSSTVVFEYGLTTGYGSTTPSQSVGSGSSPVPVTQLVTGLRPGRTYHYRLVRTP